MSEFITTSTATDPLGISTGRKLLQIASGSYAGRLALVYQDSPGSIRLSWADAPYGVWSSGALMASDAADSPFDCWMNEGGDIFIVYTAATSFDLQFRKLTFSSGAWSAGAAVTVYGADDCYNPSIALEPDNRLWVSYTRYDGVAYNINATKSDDWGATWGAGSGETLVSGASSAYSQVVVDERYIYVVYSISGTTLATKKKSYSAGLFGSEEVLASGSGFDEQFHIALSPDGRVGVAFDDGELKFREYDGSQWLALSVVDSAGAFSPRLSYPQNNALIVYQQAYGVDQILTRYSQRSGGSFSAAANLVAERNVANAVMLYSAGSYEDLTIAASSSASADVFHSGSSALLGEIGDTLYVGLDQPFALLKLILSTAGTVGVIDWQYFDGSSWVSFIPAGGAYHCGALDKELRLWDDTSSAPQDWQMTTINGVRHYYVRALVSGAFTVKPIGTQITTLSDVLAAITEVA